MIGSDGGRAAVGLGQERTSKAYDEMPRFPGIALSAEDIDGANGLAIYPPLPQAGGVSGAVAASPCRCRTSFLVL